MLTAHKMEKNSELTVSINKNSLDWLNEKYRALSPEERMAEIYNDFDKVLFTSSFGTTAAYLIHLMRKQGLNHPIHFIDTTFHFQETLDYKKE